MYAWGAAVVEIRNTQEETNNNFQLTGCTSLQTAIAPHKQPQPTKSSRVPHGGV